MEGDRDPDLKVFVVADPHQFKGPLKGTSQALEEANRQVAIARDEADQARREAQDAKRATERSAQDAIERFKASYPFQMRFPYAFEARTKPFNAIAIYRDDRCTYIRTEGRELPTVYEVVDHVPNLVGYQVEQGVIVISKVIEHGYLAIGKRRLCFRQRRTLKRFDGAATPNPKKRSRVACSWRGLCLLKNENAVRRAGHRPRPPGQTRRRIPLPTDLGDGRRRRRHPGPHS